MRSFWRGERNQALAGESVDTFAEQHQSAFELVENISLAFFTIDFLGARQTVRLMYIFLGFSVVVSIITPTSNRLSPSLRSPIVQMLSGTVAVIWIGPTPPEPIEAMFLQQAAELVPTLDIARALGMQKAHGQVLVTFGAEIGAEGLERKRTMLSSSPLNCTLVPRV